MEDNGLDGFVSEFNTEESKQSALSENRPKLKKIKRPKVRPAQPISSSVANNNINVGIDYTLIDGSTDLDNIVQDITGDSVKSNIAPENSIITMAEASNITSNSNVNTEIASDFPEQFDYVENNTFIDDYAYDENYIKKSHLYIAIVTCLFVGIFIGKVFFSSQVIEKHGLEGVVTNPDVPKGRARCGLTDKSQACIFYLMNWYKQELNGRDFFKLAAQLTGREEYMIETENLRYTTVKIRPGSIAQLNIPALK